MTDTPERASVSPMAMAHGLKTLRGLLDLHIANLERQLLIQTEQILQLQTLDEKQKNLIAKQNVIIAQLQGKSAETESAGAAEIYEGNVDGD